MCELVPVGGNVNDCLYADAATAFSRTRDEIKSSGGVCGMLQMFPPPRLSLVSLSSLQVRWVSHPHLGRQLSRLLFTSINTQPTLYLVWRGRCSSALPLYGYVQTSRLCVLLSESSARSHQLIHSLCCVLWEKITEERGGFKKQRLDRLHVQGWSVSITSLYIHESSFILAS